MRAEEAGSRHVRRSTEPSPVHGYSTSVLVHVRRVETVPKSNLPEIIQDAF